MIGNVNTDRTKTCSPKHIESKLPPSSDAEIDERFNTIKELRTEVNASFMKKDNIAAISFLQEAISHLMFYESVRTGDFQLDFNIQPAKMEKIRKDLSNLYRYLGRNYFRISKEVPKFTAQQYVKERRNEFLINAEYCCDKALGIVREPRAYRLRAEVRRWLRKVEEAKDDVREALKILSTVTSGGNRVQRELENLMRALEDDNGLEMNEEEYRNVYSPRLNLPRNTSSTPNFSLNNDKFRESDMQTAIAISAHDQEDRDLQEAIRLSLANHPQPQLLPLPHHHPPTHGQQQQPPGLVQRPVLGSKEMEKKEEEHDSFEDEEEEDENEKVEKKKKLESISKLGRGFFGKGRGISMMRRKKKKKKKKSPPPPETQKVVNKEADEDKDDE